MISDRAPKIRDERRDWGAERLEARGGTPRSPGTPGTRSTRGIMSAAGPTYKYHQSHRSYPLQPDALPDSHRSFPLGAVPYHPHAHPLSRKATANIRVRNAPTIVTTTPIKISCGCKRSASHCKKTEKTKPQITAIFGRCRSCVAGVDPDATVLLQDLAQSSQVKQ
jgi:hypothetical protein